VRLRLSEETGTVAQEELERSPQKSERHASAEQTILQATEHKILKVKLYAHAYKIHVVQILQDEDYHVRMNLCQDRRPKITNSHEFLQDLTFSDEAIFHIGGQVNCHNCSMWEGRNLQKSCNMKETPQN
jgi:hypothetical protein